MGRGRTLHCNLFPELAPRQQNTTCINFGSRCQPLPWTPGAVMIHCHCGLQGCTQLLPLLRTLEVGTQPPHLHTCNKGNMASTHQGKRQGTLTLKTAFTPKILNPHMLHPCSIPGSGRSPVRRAHQPTPVFLPGEFHGQRSLAGYSP